MKKKKSVSLLKKFLFFNLLVFSILGLFTILYLKAIQPNLVKQRSTKHIVVINNTSDHLERLKIKFDSKNIKPFLLSTRFLFQSLDRVRFYNNEGDIIGDTNILDLDQNVFSKTESIVEENIDGTQAGNKTNDDKELKYVDTESQKVIKKTILEKKNEKFDCVCGSTYTKTNKSTHFKTAFHIKYIEDKLNLFVIFN